MPKSYYRTTILIDRDLWKKFRIRAMQENKSASELLVELIKNELKDKQ
jgi:predicted CopG family antitoxin